MALGSHLITVRRLKKYIDDVIGKKANLPDTSKTIIGNIAQINTDLSVDTLASGTYTSNTVVTLSHSYADYQMIVITAKGRGTGNSVLLPSSAFSGEVATVGENSDSPVIIARFKLNNPSTNQVTIIPYGGSSDVTICGMLKN